MKGIQFRKKEIKSSLFADDIIIHIGSPKESTQKNPRTKINELYKVIEHKLNTNTIFFTVFLHSNEHLETEILKLPFIAARQNMKHNTKHVQDLYVKQKH